MKRLKLDPLTSTSSAFCPSLHSSSSAASPPPPIRLCFYPQPDAKSSAAASHLPSLSSLSGLTASAVRPSPHSPDFISIQDILPFSDEFSQCSSRQGIGGSGNCFRDGERGTSDWEAWPELESGEDSFATSWTDLLGPGDNFSSLRTCYQEDVSPNLGLEQQGGQHWPIPVTASVSQSRPAPAASESHVGNKSRLRWTPELHERFVEAVNQIGGAEQATPKGVLKAMNVEGLTIFHVKSHLQKYRIAKYIPDSPDCKADKKRIISEGPTMDPKIGIQITEALRMQMEMQKRLYDQLASQRNLQLRIEEQGKRLQKMFEEQRSGGPGSMPSAEATVKSCDEPCLRSSDSPVFWPP